MTTEKKLLFLHILLTILVYFFHVFEQKSLHTAPGVYARPSSLMLKWIGHPWISLCDTDETFPAAAGLIILPGSNLIISTWFLCKINQNSVSIKKLAYKWSIFMTAYININLQHVANDLMHCATPYIRNPMLFAYWIIRIFRATDTLYKCLIYIVVIAGIRSLSVINCANTQVCLLNKNLAGQQLTINPGALLSL